MAAARRAGEGFISPVFSVLRTLVRPTATAGVNTGHSLPCGIRGFHTTGCVEGGRPKSVWRQRRHPADTRINHELPEKIKQRKAFGGHHKMKALRVNKGLYTLKSHDIELETPILRVVHSYANKDHIDRQVIVKGSIVQIDNKPFTSWYQDNKGQTNAEQSSKESSNASHSFLEGSLYAKITSRPGQEGACNGYILEGKELETLQEDIGLNAQST